MRYNGINQQRSSVLLKAESIIGFLKAFRGSPACCAVALMTTLLLFTSCHPQIEGVQEEKPGDSGPSVAIVNRAPNIPSSLTCPATALAGSAGNACSLIAAGILDVDGDPVSYEDADSTCVNVSVSVITGDVTFNAPSKGNSCIVKVRAYDGNSYSAAISSATITGANNAPNIPLSLACPATPVAATAGNVCVLTESIPVDLDGDTISYVDDGSTCASVVINGTTGNATFTAPAKANTCIVKVKAFDGSDYSGTISSGLITGINQSPNNPLSVTCPTNPAASSTGNTCTLNAAGTPDPDGDVVSYFDDNSTCTSVNVSILTGEASFTAPTKGNSCVVKVKAFDGEAYSSIVSSATITAANNAPNEPVSFSCSATAVAHSTGNVCTLTAASPADLDGDTVSYIDEGSTCLLPVINSTTGNATFKAPAKGNTCIMKVKVFDSITYSNTISSATITATNNDPSTPTSFTCPIAPVAGSVGNACTLTAASPTDLDGDVISYENDSSTCLATIVNSTTGAATFTAPAAGATCIVKVKAYDGVSYSASRSSATITGATGTQSITFDYAGVNESWTVPAGVTTVTIDAAGAGGGVGWNCGAGGSGALVRDVITVTPGETLTVRAGGGGDIDIGDVGYWQVGGYGGGWPNGGAPDGEWNGTSGWGGGAGGGSSSVLRGAIVLVEAGGGAGAAENVDGLNAGGASDNSAGGGNKPGQNSGGAGGGGGGGWSGGLTSGNWSVGSQGGSSHYSGAGTITPGGGGAGGGCFDPDNHPYDFFGGNGYVTFTWTTI